MEHTRLKEGRIGAYVGVVLIVFALYRALPFTQLVPTLIARKISFFLLMVVVYLTTKPWKSAGTKATIVVNLVFFLVGAAAVGYLIWLWRYLPYRMMSATPTDVVFGSMTLFVLFDLLRRKTGWALVVISTIFILYMVFGTSVPVRILRHEPISWGDTVFALTTGPRGMWGTPLGVIIDFVILFITFGAIFLTTGVIDYFLRLACYLTRGFRSGPGLVALITSALFGMISGSAAGNVSTTGNFTIPLMKKVGYPGETAAGIEVAASIGGQWMPPIMGASAFIMAGLLGIPYMMVVQNALIPALLYFLAVGAMIVAISGKRNIAPMPEEEFEKLASTTPREWILSTLHVGLPVACLLYFLMSGYSPGVAAAYAVLTLIAASLIFKERNVTYRERLGEIWAGMERAGSAVLPVAMATAAAGIIVGSIATTGAAVKLTALIVGASGGNLIIAILLIIIASLFLGIGSPVTAAYLIVAIVAAGALEQLGVPLLVGHLICFWYAIDSEVTPPVCISSYAAAGIAGSDPWRTALQGWKAAKGLYFIPILVATTPIVPITWEGHSALEIALAIVTAALGLIVVSAVLERFYFRRLTIAEVSVFVICGVMMFLPFVITDLIGIAVFLALTVYVWNGRGRTVRHTTGIQEVIK